jgi:hypothetical protein
VCYIAFMETKNKTIKIISLVALCAAFIFFVLIVYGVAKKDAAAPVADRTYTDEELKYAFNFPGDGRRIYETNTLGEGSITVDAGIADKPGRYIHTVSSISVLPIGEYRDNGIRTDAELEQRKSERPRFGYRKVVIDKQGVPGFCYYQDIQGVDDSLRCRYEYRGNAYYISANNPSNEKTSGYFEGTGDKNLLQVGEDIIRSFRFLP